MREIEVGPVVAWLLIFVVGILFVLSLMFGLPHYNVWEQNMDGLARLAKAEQTKQILVTQATAEKEAAKMTAEAISIVGEAAKKYPEYRDQEFIRSFASALENGNIHQIIYVPTEAGIPITEAGRITNKE